METTSRPVSLIPSVAYAKNATQERFIQSFEGKLKGRYVIGFLVGVEFLGGAPLRQRIEAELGNPHYAPDQWVLTRDAAVIFDRAVRAGVSVERIGELVMPAYKRSNPKAFANRSIMSAVEVLERGYREDTTYGGVSPEPDRTPGCMRVYRTGAPLPCQFFVGVIKGLFQCFSIIGTVRETACQWEGAKGCCYEARWTP